MTDPSRPTQTHRVDAAASPALADAPRQPAALALSGATPPRGEGVGITLAERFVVLYRAHFEYVWRTLRKLGMREADLPDLTHDVFVVVHRKLEAYDATRPAKPWLFGIAFRVALDRRRKMSSWRETLVDEMPASAAAASASPALAEEHLAARDAHALVMRALDVLDLDKRSTFVLHEMDGVNAPDIAQILDVPLNTVYSRLRAARELFSAEIHRLHGGPTAKGGAR
mgnify:FL=1